MNKRIAGLTLAAALAVIPIAPAAEAQAHAPSTSQYATVRSGDTLSGIALTHHTTWEHLASINHLLNPNRIYPGERLLLSGSSGTTPKPKPKPKPTPAPTSGSKVVAYAETLRGIRYVWGGESRSGFDCSGLTQYVFAHLGKRIPRVADDQYRAAQHVSSPKPGDLVFVHDSSGYVYHVAIYVNSHTWLEAERPGRGVGLYAPWSRSVSYGRFTVK
jgi:cell wall-associated NlpC family hydrolase